MFISPNLLHHAYHYSHTWQEQPYFPFHSWLRLQICASEVKQCFNRDPHKFTLEGSREQQEEQGFKGKLMFIPLRFQKGLDRPYTWRNRLGNTSFGLFFFVCFWEKIFLVVLFEYEVAQGSKVSLSLSVCCVCRRVNVKNVNGNCSLV